MPVIAHNAIPTNPHPEPLDAFTKYPLKRQEVIILTKDPKPTIRTVQNMIDVPAQSCTLWPRHRQETLTESPPDILAASNRACLIFLILPLKSN